jgi:hypothetical protein
MKKSILLVLSLFFSSLVCADINFTTTQLAAQYCPAFNALQYVQLAPVNNGKGQIQGTHNQVLFLNQYKSASIGPYVLMPRFQGDNHDINSVSWRNVEGSYGRLTDVGDYAQITCLYSYPGFTGVSVTLVMAGVEKIQ